MPDQLKNLQAAARRRGLSLSKEKISDDGAVAFCMYAKSDTHRRGPATEYFDLAEVRDELRSRPIEA
jgi:hypothetical protein